MRRCGRQLPVGWDRRRVLLRHCGRRLFPRGGDQLLERDYCGRASVGYAVHALGHHRRDSPAGTVVACPRAFPGGRPLASTGCCGGAAVSAPRRPRDGFRPPFRSGITPPSHGGVCCRRGGFSDGRGGGDGRGGDRSGCCCEEGPRHGSCMDSHGAVCHRGDRRGRRQARVCRGASRGAGRRSGCHKGDSRQEGATSSPTVSDEDGRSPAQGGATPRRPHVRFRVGLVAGACWRLLAIVGGRRQVSADN